MAKTIGKWLKYMGHGLNIYGARFMYLRDGIGMLQMT